MSKEKNPAAVALGKAGGSSRWKGKTKEEKSKHRKMMADKRWEKYRLKRDDLLGSDNQACTK